MDSGDVTLALNNFAFVIWPSQYLYKCLVSPIIFP